MGLVYGDVIIIRIEKHYFCYEYAVWMKQETFDGKDVFGYGSFKKLNLGNMNKDNDLKIRVEWALLKQKNGT
jgi:hypothetical protein